MICRLCNKNNPVYLIETLKGIECWCQEDCLQRANTLSPLGEDRDCISSDYEQMYVALKKIIAITGHDHSNPIHEIAIEGLAIDRRS